jgi:hypothetical protein
MVDVKQVTTDLLQKEFGDVLAHIEFFGPHEDEDLDASVWLHEKPKDVGERYHRIFRALRKQNLDVPMALRPWPKRYLQLKNKA